MPKRRNSWHQNNGYDCGIAVCHYMEEELRAVRGEGLGRSWPQPEKIRERIQKYLQQLQREWGKWFLEQQKAGVVVVVLDKDEVEEDGKKMEASVAAWHEAHKGPGKRLVLEFRCSRCRWSVSGKGCISCNPFKKAHKIQELEMEAEKNAAAYKRAADGEAALDAPEPPPPPLPAPPLPPPEEPPRELRGGGGAHFVSTQQQRMGGRQGFWCGPTLWSGPEPR
jgi:hypothetical protein